MLTIRNKDIYRANVKIGWIRENDIYDHAGKKLGYFMESNGDIFNYGGTKVAYLEGDYLVMLNGKKLRLDENHAKITGGLYSELARAAIRLFLGD